MRVELSQYGLSDYLAWLRAEIQRIEQGGAHEPWLTREQSLARLRTELAAKEAA